MEHVNKDLSVDLLGPNRHHFGFLSGVFFFNVTVDFSGLLKTTLSLYLVERQQKEHDLRAERAALLSTVCTAFGPAWLCPLLLCPPLSPPSLFSKHQRSPGYEHQSEDEDFFQAFFYSSFYIKKIK